MRIREFHKDHDEQAQASADIRDVTLLWERGLLSHDCARRALRRAGACEPEINEIIGE